MATLQIKSMDDRLYKALGVRAEMNNHSINQEVIMIIRDFLARPPQNTQQATQALLELAGSWQDERTAKQMASDIRKARRSGRRFGKDSDIFD